jgi:excisionase family DNA binding protein
VSVSTLYGWVWQRRVPFVKIGRALRFDSGDLEGFVEANKQNPREEIYRSSGRVPVCYNARAAGKG